MKVLNSCGLFGITNKHVPTLHTYLLALCCWMSFGPSPRIWDSKA